MTAPLRDSPFWKSHALKIRSKHWPFTKGVPMRIRMTKTVRPDFPFLLTPEERTGMFLTEGRVYVATTNSHGAVSGVCDSGHELGVKPDEFEVVEWYQLLPA